MGFKGLKIAIFSAFALICMKQIIGEKSILMTDVIIKIFFTKYLHSPARF
jgi:hypothetical protein